MGEHIAAEASSLKLSRFSGLRLVLDTPKGRAIFAAQDIAAGTVLETCPVLVLTQEENAEHIEHTSLYHYTYNWPLVGGSGEVTGQTQAVILGLGSMFNHSRKRQNVGWQRDVGHQIITYRALRDIAAGEELCISYGDHLTFVDVDKEASYDSQGEEDEHEILSKIQLG